MKKKSCILILALAMGLLGLVSVSQAAGSTAAPDVVALQALALSGTVVSPVSPLIARRCRPGWRWSPRLHRCVRWRHWRRHRCRPGWRWVPRWRRCVRWHARRCPAGWHWNARWRRCVRHGWRRCRAGWRYSYRLRRCIRGRWRRCPPGWHYHPAWHRCLRW